VINNLQLAVLNLSAIFIVIFVLGFLFGRFAFPKNAKTKNHQTHTKNDDTNGVVS